ncbi:exosome catalytic subunit dis3 [Homalodisca vitripennis]|nr:exosome catalytic subunit dis3 [Homalodisca vitripennis]
MAALHRMAASVLALGVSRSTGNKHEYKETAVTDRYSSNVQLARWLFALASKIADYVRSLSSCPLLADKLSSHSFSAEGKVALFPTHLTPSQVHEAVKAGKVLQGAFQASRENFLEGQVNVEGFSKPWKE